jgi:hypothetical protein
MSPVLEVEVSVALLAISWADILPDDCPTDGQEYDEVDPSVKAASTFAIDMVRSLHLGSPPRIPFQGKLIPQLSLHLNFCAFLPPFYQFVHPNLYICR